MNLNPKILLNKFFPHPKTIPIENLPDVKHLSDTDKEILRRVGMTVQGLTNSIRQSTEVNYDRVSLYREIDRALSHPIISCLRGDTKIRLCNGTSPTIKEMAENPSNYIGKHIWSVNLDTLDIEADTILVVQKTKLNASLVRVHLDNNKYVDCTPDHRFMLCSGLYKEAKDLLINNNLMPVDSLIDNKYIKVVRVEFITDTEDVYDITTARNHNFSLDNGVIVHNSSLELYADTASMYSTTSNASVWITSENSSTSKILNKLLDDISIEEKIYDWCWTTGGFGDLPLEVNAAPELGVISINDDRHPLDVSRVDFNGILIGWVESPNGNINEGSYLMPPWKFSQIRLLGARRKRNLYGELNFNASREVLTMGAEKGQLSSKYGVSLITNALPIYKRLRLAEDSLLLTRLNRAVKRYVWKIKVTGQNGEAVAELMDEYKRVLKTARALDTTSGASQGSFEEKFDMPTSLTDIILPVFGEVGDIEKDEIGGDVDIKWICLRGNTEIKLLDGTSKDIKTIVDNKEKYIGKYVYSCSKDGNIVPRKIKDARITKKNAKFVRVHLDNKEFFDVTPDHRCMLRDGTFLEAEKLVPGQSLMPLYIKRTDENGLPCYEKFYNPKTSSWLQTHRLVAKDALKDEFIAAGRLGVGIDTRNKHKNRTMNSIWVYSSILGKEKFINKSELDVFISNGWSLGRLSKSMVLNHKVMRIEYLDVIEDAYDLTIDGEEHTFALAAGVFVHNCDIEDYRNQLACALRTPLSLLGGYVSEASGALGNDLIENLGIRFGQNARRLQRAIKSAIARICQIHLAYKGMDPSVGSFTVHMAETSAIEESQIRDNVDKGIDSIVKVLDLLDTLNVEVDKVGVFDYLNKKFLKLEDFNIDNFLKNKNINFREAINKLTKKKLLLEKTLYVNASSDLKSYLPVVKAKESSWLMNESTWKEKFGQVKINGKKSV